ncbi:MAG: hypothetical protein RDU14_16620 [Melioribacteraceae bacterium]|nr:hypothetical protein [Melioribacteraceae bacterium]
MFKWISALIEWLRSFFRETESKAPTVNDSAINIPPLPESPIHDDDTVLSKSGSTENKISITKGSSTDEVKQNRPPRRSKMKKKSKNAKRKNK